MDSFHAMFTIFLLFMLGFTTARCDEALIHQLCSTTVQPVICLECIKSYPNNENVEYARQLAVIAIDNCAHPNLSLLHEDTKEAAENTTDAFVKKLLLACTWMFNQAQTSLYSGAREFIRHKMYTFANIEINDYLLPKITYCVEQFDEYPEFALPPKVLAGIENVKLHIAVVKDMVDFLFLDDLAWYNL